MRGNNDVLFSVWIMISIQVSISQVLPYRIVCYYTNWSQYRAGEGKFLPNDIDASKCTHIVYAHAGMNVNFTIKSTEVNDLPSGQDPGMFIEINKLKDVNPRIKTILSVGGFELSPTFTYIVQTKGTRAVFIESVIKYLRLWGFDGVDIKWEFPTRRGSPLTDKEKFSDMLEEMKEAFDEETQESKRPALILSASVSGSKLVMDDAYEVEDIAESVDFLNIIAYDFAGHWDGWTGHSAPLYERGDEVGHVAYNNVNRSVLYWVEQGVPPEKINVGVSPYARTFTIELNNGTVPGVKSLGPGRRGAFTKDAGGLAYYEVCNIARMADIYWDVIQKVPYMVLENQWISFENERSILEKIEFIKSYDFGGVMLWNMPTDDVINSCGSGASPMLNTLFERLQLKSFP